MDEIWHSTTAKLCVAAGAIVSGLGSMFELTQQHLGVLSTLAGTILSLTMAWSSWRRTRIEARRAELDYIIRQEQRARDNAAYAVVQDLDGPQGDTESTTTSK